MPSRIPLSLRPSRCWSGAASTLIWALVLMTAAASAAPVTFYVSTSGDDAAAGTSSSSPWRTLARAAAAARGLEGGSSLLLRRGDVWLLDTAMFVTDLRGSLAAPVTISDYTDATVTTDARPRLTRSTPAAGPTLTINNATGVVVAGLEIVGGETGIAFTYDTQGGAPTTYESFTVTDCVFNQITGLHYNASSGSWWAPGVAFAAAHAGVRVHNVTISHNIFNGSDVMYQNSLPFLGWTRAYVSNLRVDANAAIAMSYNTLFLDSTSDVLVSRNVFLRNTPAQLFVAGTTDIILGTLNSSVRITGNEISARGEYQPGGPDGCAVDFETNATGVEFSENYVSHSFGAGIMVFGHVSGSNTQLRITNNTMLYNGCLQQRGDHGGIAFMRPGSSGVLSGNVFATCPGTPLFYDALDPGMPGWVLSDNAIDGADGVTLAVVATPVVAAAATPTGGVLVTASCATQGAVLRYTLDASLPTPASPPFPAAGVELASRSSAVLVKAFPAAAAAAAAAVAGVVHVESAVAGGFFSPSSGVVAPAALGDRAGASAVARSSPGSVLVYDSTPAGVVAAVAAARAGAAVTLLDASPRVGGMCSGGLGHTDVGDAFAIGGLAREFFLRNARVYNATATEPLYFLEPHVAEAVFTEMLASAGVRHVRGRVASVAFAAGPVARIASVTTVAGDTYAADVFVDASYEGALVVRAAAAGPRATGGGAAAAPPAGGSPALAWTFGRESRAVYGESWAGRREPFEGPFDFRPISPLDAHGNLLPMMTTRISAPLGSGDARVQGYNYRLCAVRGSASPNFLAMPDPAPGTYNGSDWEALRRFAALPGITSVDQFIGPGGVPGGKLDINNGCLISTDATGLEWAFPQASYAQQDALRASHKAYTVAFFYTLRTDPAIPAPVRASAAELGLCRDEFVSNGGFPEALYIREAVRLVGDRVLVQGDLWPSATAFHHASIGLGSYAADGHYATRGPCVAAPDGASCAMVTSEAQLQAALAAGTLWTGGEGYVGSTNRYALYQIPAFALWPARAGATNLLSPTAPSASHVTFASLRVEPTYMVMGHAAGRIAALAAAARGAVQDVNLDDLHAALAADGAVLCHEGYPHCS